MLERNCHSDSCFVTLTYSDDNLPGGNNYASLERKHFTDWLKRFRKSVEPTRIRYFGVGEYGDVSFRPHYHAAIFGYPQCQHGMSRYSKGRQTCCPTCDLVRDTWGLGIVHVGTLEVESAQYIAGYVTKKMTHRTDDRLEGRDPEFAAMSLRPGIGAQFVPEIASTLLQFNLDSTQADVPVSLRHGTRQLPLGRYMRRLLRQQIGKNKEAPRNEKQEKEMLSLLSRSVDNETTFKTEVLEENKGKVASMEARQRIFSKRKTGL